MTPGDLDLVRVRVLVLPRKNLLMMKEKTYQDSLLITTSLSLPLPPKSLLMAE